MFRIKIYSSYIRLYRKTKVLYQNYKKNLKMCLSSVFLIFRLNVNDDILNPFLESLSLSDAIKAKRIFKVDLQMLDGIESENKDFVVTNTISGIKLSNVFLKSCSCIENIIVNGNILHIHGE